MKIAYLTPNALFPVNRGGRIRAHHLWRAMSAFGDVTPVIIGDTPAPHLRDLLRSARATFFPRRRYKIDELSKAIARNAPFVMPSLMEAPASAELPDEIWRGLGSAESLVVHCLNPDRIERLLGYLRKLRPDVIVLCDSSLGLLASHVRSLGAKVIVGPHNFDSALYASMAANAPNDELRRWNLLAAQAFAEAERLFVNHVDQLWVCSRADQDRFASALIPRSKIRVVPNVYDVGEPTRLDRASRDLVFVGQANYYPNEEAVRALFTISRRLDEKGVTHRMRIVGRIEPALRQLAREFGSVDVVGPVDSVAPYLEDAAVAPIALTLGGGTRLKIVEALAMARPVLSTPIGIEGIEAEDGVNAVIEPDLAAFPERIEELLLDRDRAERIALRGWELARSKYSHEALTQRVGEAFRDLGFETEARTDFYPARNFGADVINETATFNPLTRLLDWVLLVRISATFDDMTAEITMDGAQDAPNAFVTVKRRPKGYIGFEVTAMLSPNVNPNQVAIRIFAWGRLALYHRAPASIASRTSGLVALEAGPREITATGWSLDDRAAFDPPSAANPTPSLASRDGVRMLRGQFEALSQPLTLSSAAALGETLSAPALWLQTRLPSSARLRQFKDKHAGETAWLIGNGPSVRLTDLDKLQGRLTFCFNRFLLAHGSTKLRATYTLTGDKQMIEDFGQDIVDESGGTVFIAHDQPPDLVGDYIWLRQMAIFPPLFSYAPERVVSPGGSTPYVAMQLAYYMGVRKFYFYGADFTFRFEKARRGGDSFRTASGEGNHFIPNYRSGRPWCPPSLRDIGAAFLGAKLLMEAEGGFIRNVTRGGALEIFEREDFDSAVSVA